MSDLLDRLNTWRVSCGRPDLCGEAIAEIEGLTAENAQLRKMFEELVEESKLDVAEGARLRALNAVLLALVKEVWDDADSHYSRGEDWLERASRVIAKVEGK